MRRAAGRSPQPNGQGGRTTPLKCPGRDPNGPKWSRFRPRMRQAIGDALSPREKKTLQHSLARLHPIGYSIPCHSLLSFLFPREGPLWLGFPVVPSSAAGLPTSALHRCDSMLATAPIHIWKPPCPSLASTAAPPRRLLAPI
jgi:hypothetical protein